MTQLFNTELQEIAQYGYTDDIIRKMLQRAWNDGYKEGQNDKVEEVDEFYGRN